MSAKKTNKPNEKPPGSYTALPHSVTDSRAFLGSSNTAKVVLFALLRQHNGRNNGHFAATLAMMSCFANIKSNDTIGRAIEELIARRLIVRTKRGGLNAGASLYGATWLNLTDCRGLDVTADGIDLGAWKFYEPTEDDKLPKRDTSHASRARSDLARMSRDGTAAQTKPGKNTRRTPLDGAASTVRRCDTAPSGGTVSDVSAPTHGAKRGNSGYRAAPSDGDKCIVPGAPAPASGSGSSKGVPETNQKASLAHVVPFREDSKVAISARTGKRKFV